MSELKELYTPPFRNRDNYILDAHDNVICTASYWLINDSEFIAAALNEKWERDYAERWIVKAHEPFNGNLALICPKCDSIFTYQDLYGDSQDFNYCPHCGIKLLPPEEK